MDGRAIKTLVISLIMSALVGCGDNDRQGSAGQWRGTRELVDDIEVVRNPATPLNTIDAGFRVVWRAPDHDGVERFGEWLEAVNIVVSGDHIYVLDRMGHRVFTVETADGRVIAAWGRRGRGPGEFELPFDVAFSDSAIFVGNGGGRSLERYHPDGMHEGTVPLGGLGFSLLSIPSGELYVNKLTGAIGGWSRVGDEGTLAEVDWPATAGFELGSCTQLGGGEGVLVRMSCTQPLMQLLETDGRVIREITIERPEFEPDPQLIDDYIGKVRATMTESGMTSETIERQVVTQRERLSVLSVMRGATQDGSTGMITVWEQLPDDLGEDPATIHRFAATGEYLAAVHFDEAWVDFAVHEGRIYALTRNAISGIVGLTAYELESSHP